MNIKKQAKRRHQRSLTEMFNRSLVNKRRPTLHGRVFASYRRDTGWCLITNLPRFHNRHKQPFNVCLDAVTCDPFAIRHLSIRRRKDETLALAAVTAAGQTLQYIPHQTDKVCLAAVTHDGCALRFVKNRTYEICLAAVQNRGIALEHVPTQTPEICLAAVCKDGSALEFVKEQTLEICLAAVHQDGWALQYVKQQTPEICREALTNSGLILRHVKEPTYDMYLAAIKNDGYALEYIPQQTEELIMAALSYSGRTLQYVTNPTPEMCLKAIQTTKSAIQLVPRSIQTLEMCLTSLKNEDSANYVYFNEELLTPENLKLFIDEDPGVAEFFLERMTPELFEYAVRKGWTTAGYHYNHLHTDELRFVMLENNPWVVTSWPSRVTTEEMWIHVASIRFDVVEYAMEEKLLSQELFSKLQLLFGL